jgi:hypothetical protein
MKHRFTLKELDEWDDADILRMLVNERISQITNPYVPFNTRLMRIRANLHQGKLEKVPKNAKPGWYTKPTRYWRGP